MGKGIIQHLDEPCHNCGGTYQARTPLTRAEWQDYFGPEAAKALPWNADSAPPDVVERDGPLAVCDGCGTGMRGLTRKSRPPAAAAPQA